MACRWKFTPRAAASAGVTPQAMRDHQWAFERMAERSIEAARAELEEKSPALKR